MARTKQTARISTGYKIPGPPVKLLLVGAGGVGKTSIAQKLKNNSFEEKYIPTLGVAVVQVQLSNSNSFNIWDVAGQEKFGGLRDGYYIQGQCCILVFDTTSTQTFTACLSFAREVKRVSENAKFAVICNKMDLKDNSSRANAQKYCETNEYPYFEVSAKTDSQEKITDIFEKLFAFWYEGQYLSFRDISMFDNTLTNVIQSFQDIKLNSNQLPATTNSNSNGFNFITPTTNSNGSGFNFATPTTNNNGNGFSFATTTVPFGANNNNNSNGFGFQFGPPSFGAAVAGKIPIKQVLKKKKPVKIQMKRSGVDQFEVNSLVNNIGSNLPQKVSVADQIINILVSLCNDHVEKIFKCSLDILLKSNKKLLNEKILFTACRLLFKGDLVNHIVHSSTALRRFEPKLKPSQVPLIEKNMIKIISIDSIKFIIDNQLPANVRVKKSFYTGVIEVIEYLVFSLIRISKLMSIEKQQTMIEKSILKESIMASEDLYHLFKGISFLNFIV